MVFIYVDVIDVIITMDIKVYVFNVFRRVCILSSRSFQLKNTNHLASYELFLCLPEMPVNTITHTHTHLMRFVRTIWLGLHLNVCLCVRALAHVDDRSYT